MADHQWEYATLEVRNAATAEDQQATNRLVANLGAEHWELVAVRSTPEASAPGDYQLFFKRPKAKGRTATQPFDAAVGG